MVKFYKILYDSIKKQTSFKNQIMKFLSFTEKLNSLWIEHFYNTMGENNFINIFNTITNSDNKILFWFGGHLSCTTRICLNWKKNFKIF